MLTVIESHPVQYHAPVYRSLQCDFGVPVRVIYGSDFSISGYRDREFNTSFAWDADLLSGYESVFLSRVTPAQPATAETVSTRGLRKALRRHQPSLILLVGYSPKFYRQTIRQAFLSGSRLLFRAETTDHARPRSRLKGSVRDFFLRNLYARCSRLLFVGEHSRRHFQRLGCPDSKLVFSPYCVDTATFELSEPDRDRRRQETRERLQLQDDHLAVLYSGKLSHRKGVDLLVSAVKQLESVWRKKVVTLFLGDGPMRQDLESAANGEPKINVRFLGFQNQTKLSEFYHAADMLVLPSRWSETWGLVVNEALHHGLPSVVSSAVGCAPDLIAPGSTGEVCDPDSAESMAAAVLRAARYARLKSTQDECRRRVGGYTVKTAAAGIAQAYHDTIPSIARTA